MSGTNSIAFARHRMNKRRCDHFVGGRLTGSFDSAVGITTSYANEVAHRIVRRHILMISENRIARNDIDEVKYVE